MRLLGFLDRIALTPRRIVQAMQAENAVRGAEEREVSSVTKLALFDAEAQRIDETLNRLRDQGALLD